MRVVFDARAVEDLEGIFQFIAADSPVTARSVVDRIVASIERLELFPEMARVGLVRRHARMGYPAFAVYCRL